MTDNNDEIQQQCQDQTGEHYPEGGWGWVICAAAFFSSFVVFGIHTSFGVLYANLVDELDLGEAETAWIGSMAGSLNFLCGPIASRLCDHYGCRAVAFTGVLLAVLGLFLTSFVQEPSKMYVTYGLLWGVGSSFSFIPSIVVLGQYFNRRFALANGIASSGSGVGGLLAAPFINYLLSSVKWQNTMRILSCVAMLLWVSALLYRPVQTHTPCVTQRQRKTMKDVPSVWLCKPYIVLVVAVAVFQLCYPVPYMHLVKFAEDKGIPSSRGSWLLGILAISSTASKIIFGKISELRCVNRILLFQTAIFGMGLATVLCPISTGYAGVLCYAVIFGLFDGCFVGQLPVVMTDIVGHDRLSQALGNMFGVIAVPMSFGSPIAGWLYEAFGSYDGAFYVAGSAAIFTSLLLFLIPCMLRKRDYYEVSHRHKELKHSSNTPRRPRNKTAVRYYPKSSKSGSCAMLQAVVRGEMYSDTGSESPEKAIILIQRETVL